MLPIEPDDCLAMRWPSHQSPHEPTIDDAYRLCSEFSREKFSAVQSAIGFVVTEDHWIQVSESRLPGFMVFAELRSTREPVAVAMARQAPGDFAELAWVAVSSAHRGRGLGAAVCARIVSGLVSAHRSGFLSTQDHRLEALRIYFALGFHPVYRERKVGRWRSVCSELRVPFDPDTWGWPG